MPNAKLFTLNDKSIENSSVSSEPREQLVFIGPKTKFPECFMNALHSEIPEITIHSWCDVDTFDQLTIAQLEEIKFVFVHQSICENDQPFFKKIQQLLSEKTLILAYHDGQDSIHFLNKYNATFQSHLPMDVRLDVWLSIIRLLLSGGKYYSPDLVKQTPIGQEKPTYNPQNSGEVQLTSAISISEKMSQEATPCAKVLEKLTNRELDVLKLVSEGLQNKLIANNLGLSENTVKLHIHNLISKLNVTNRTEAAALFLRSSAVGAYR